MRFNRTSFFIAIALFTLLGVSLKAADIQGRIQDLGGRPLKNVTVTAAEVGQRVFSDDNGQFTVHVGESSGEVRLLFECPGYYPETLRWKAQNQPARLEVLLTPQKVLKQEIKVVASRLDIALNVNPAATSIVGGDVLETMPRAVAIDEALLDVPGVKVDNQANGERVHLSIRGQGILSERGIRGVQVLYDGVPLSDPSGFVPDLFDVDWAGVEEVNVVRGPVAFLYGGGSAGGVIDIHTRDLEYAPFHGGIEASGGSNGFYKTRGQVSGTAAGVSYLISGSRTAGDGYRQHTAFWANNGYARFSFNPTRRLRLSPFLMATGFFNQNAEGLNLVWMQQSWTIANPDALTYNEYQRTLRLTTGLTGQWAASEQQRLSFTFYARRTGYLEPVPSSVDHRTLTSPGGSVQYDYEGKSGRVAHHFSSGLDLDGQLIGEYRHPNLGQAREGPELLSDQSITQNRVGAFATERLTLGPRWTVLLGARVDRIGNQLDDHLRANGLDLSGSRTFTKATARAGITWNATKRAALYASWGQGFLPPATEELYANPAALGGFNRALVPATSNGIEGGVRGSVGNRLFYDAAVFHLDTKNDFERYRIASRPLETFYGNAGQSSRYGLETSLKWLPLSRLTLAGAYTYSHFAYTRYESLTYPGDLIGNRLPNSPAQQFSADANVQLPGRFSLGMSTIAYSRAYIDPTNRTWIDGYGLLNARVGKTWQRGATYGTIFLAGKNLTANRYIAFTEPDPDGNSYQPGPSREIFAGLQFQF